MYVFKVFTSVQNVELTIEAANYVHAFFHKQRFFSTQFQCSLTLVCKWMDWFPYDRDLRHELVTTYSHHYAERLFYIYYICNIV